MKKVLLVLALSLAFNTLSAQEDYGTFKSGTIKSSLVIESGKVYLDLNEESRYGLVLDKKSRVKFVEFLKSSRVKFLDWSNKAIENGVKDMTKDIGSIKTRVFFKYGSWHFGSSNLTAIFGVTKRGSVNMYIYGSAVTSSNNQYIESDSVIMSLTSDKDFDSLIDVLSDDTINSFIEKKSNNEKLFN